jgi:hypothetical protein
MLVFLFKCSVLTFSSGIFSYFYMLVLLLFKLNILNIFLTICLLLIVFECMVVKIPFNAFTEHDRLTTSSTCRK